VWHHDILRADGKPYSADEVKLIRKLTASGQEAASYKVIEKPDEICISTPQLEAAVRKRGYVSGVRGGSFTDKKTGFHDPGFGLDIVDWIMEPGSDQAYRDQLEGDLAYHFNTTEHGRRSNRSIEGPQICTQAKELSPEVIRGNDFVAIRQQYKYHLAAPGKKTGSTWTQWIVFPKGKPDPGKRLPEKGERPSREVMANTDRSNLAVVWPNRS
jgi:hypothetical protein